MSTKPHVWGRERRTFQYVQALPVYSAAAGNKMCHLAFPKVKNFLSSWRATSRSPMFCVGYGPTLSHKAIQIDELCVSSSTPSPRSVTPDYGTCQPTTLWIRVRVCMIAFRVGGEGKNGLHSKVYLPRPPPSSCSPTHMFRAQLWQSHLLLYLTLECDSA